MAVDDFGEGLDEFDDDLTVNEESVGEVAAQEAEVSRTLVEAFRGRGVELPEDIDDDRLFSNLQQLYERASNAPDPMELAELREIRSRYRQEQEGQKRRETAETSEETKPAPKVSRVEYPADAEQYVQWDDKAGAFVPKSEKYPNVAAVEAMNRWHQQSESNKKRLLADPLGYLYESGLNDKFAEFEKSIEQRIMEKLQSEQTQRATQEEQIQWWSENGGKLFERNANGEYRKDLAGNEIPTAQGRVYIQRLQSLQAQGLTGPGAVKYAFDESEKWAKRQSRNQAGAETGAGTGDPKKDFVQKGRAADEQSKRNGKQRVVERAASVVTAAEQGLPQNGGEGFTAIAMRNAKAKGLN